MWIRTSRACLLSFSLIFARGGFAAVLYISSQGNDHWSGRISQPNLTGSDGPLASLIGARDVLRRHGPPTEPVKVFIADGTYQMTEPLVLTPADSGTADCPIRYQAAPGAHPVFSGGRIISGWKPEGHGLWSADIPEVRTGTRYFEQLWVNDRRAIRARYPNKGFLTIDTFREEPLRPNESAALKVPSDWTRQIIGLKPGDLKIISQLTAAEVASIQFLAPQNWLFIRRFLDGIDLKTGVFTAIAPPMHPDACLCAGGRYYLEGARPFLDAPGEWFLDHSGRIYYRPRQGEDMRRAKVVAPQLETLVEFRGDAAGSQWVQHLVFSGLSFYHSQWLTLSYGTESVQAAEPVGAALIADGARDITLEDCELAHLGQYGAWFRAGCSAVVIQRCHLHDLGAGGIRIGTPARPADPADATTDVRVDNNIINEGGRIFAEAVGIWIGQSGHNRITHNDVSDFYYTAISVGWSWDYAATLATGNDVGFNHIHHLGWGLLSDMGGIYTLGESPGTVLHDNVIHDILAAEYGGWGIYFDGATSHVLAENNLVYATMSGGLHLHYGTENIVRNSIFATSRDAQLQLTKVEPHLSLIFSHNIVYWTTGSLFARDWKGAHVEMDDNLYFHAGRGPVLFDGLTFPAWQALGRDQHSKVADPRFRNPRKNDYRLRDDSPAFQLGYHTVDFSRAGVYGSADWLELARSLAHPAPPDWVKSPRTGLFSRPFWAGILIASPFWP